MILKQNFFNRSALEVAPELLGKFLVRKHKGKTIVGMIREVEAYNGPFDKASHASKGRTPRTEIMFGPPGYFYIYLCYGFHWMLNVITGEEGYPAAILIRSVQYLEADLPNIEGPGRVTKFFGIDGKLNGKSAFAQGYSETKLVLPENGLWFEDRGDEFSMKIKRAPRIGVASAGRVWSKKPYRFFVD